MSQNPQSDPASTELSTVTPPPADLALTEPPVPSLGQLPALPQLQFFVARPEQIYGPYTLQEVNAHLLSGHIKALDLAWYEGAAGWTPLHQISGVVTPSVPVAPPPASYPAPQPDYAPQQGGYPQQGYAPQQGHPQQQLYPQQNSFGNQSGAGAIESVVFEITPSILPDLVWCALTCGLGLLALPWRYMGKMSNRYRLTTERLIVTTGLVSKRTEEVEIYRVKDITVEQGNIGRMLDIGTVTVFVNDATSPHVYLQSISQPVKVKEQIRQISRAARKAEGIQSVEYLPSS